MRRSILLLCCLFGGLFADSSASFAKAIELEKAGDSAGALQIYKSLAKEYVFGSKDSADLSDSNKPIVLIKPAKPASSDPLNELFDKINASAHELNYILPATHTFSAPNDGRRNFETKFNISFKKPLELSFLGQDKQIFLAYSQTSWWQTAKASVPFRETNYRPEAFLRYSINYGWLKALDFGLLHESNGLGGDTSRSWNRAYVGAELESGNLQIRTRLWQSVGDLSDNPDIAKYFGYGDLRIKYGKGDWGAEILLRNNLRKDNKGAAQLGLVFPFFGGFLGYLQYFYGYGESMIDYNHKINRISIGIAATR